MKKSLILLIIVVHCFSCSKEDPIIQEEQKVEKTALAADIVESMLLINGATLKDGMPPRPNGDAPNFKILKEKNLANPIVGFELPFAVDDNFSGIYLQIEGSDQYYDIPFSSANVERRKEEQLYTLPVNLSENITQGYFCAYACVYDESGNVSIVQTFCTTISSWGGNDEIIGDWQIKKLEIYVNNELLKTQNFDWGKIDSQTVDCFLGESVGFKYGDQNTTLAGEGIYQDRVIDSTDCPESIAIEYGAIGRWSFDEDGQNLSWAVFESYENILGGTPNVNTLDDPILIAWIVESLSVDEMILREDYGVESANYNLVYYSRQ